MKRVLVEYEIELRDTLLVEVEVSDDFDFKQFAMSEPEDEEFAATWDRLHDRAVELFNVDCAARTVRPSDLPQEVKP